MTSPSDLLDEIIPAQPSLSRERVWSPFQTAVFDAIKKSDEDILIQAVAGSGKTTTILKGMEYVRGSSLFMAFNKAIAADILTRTDKGVVKTLNALGHGIMKAKNPRGELDSRKVLDILKTLLMAEDFKEYGFTLSRVIGLAKNNAFGIERSTTSQDFSDLTDSYQMDIPADRLEEMAFLAMEAFHRSTLSFDKFDFDDQLYLPILNDWDFPSFDNVFVDEAQDLSPIQHAMLGRLKERGSRIIAVGDRHQAIYGFRGASHDSMDILKRLFDMKELPLSITYRCGTAIVKAARAYCDTIQAASAAASGQVLNSEEDPEIFTNSLILCRNNAPLFKAILKHVRAKEPCQVLSNFLESFQGFVRRFKSVYTADLLTKLDKWYEKEVTAAKEKGFRGKVAGLTDRYETVRLLAKDYRLTDDMVRMVKGLGDVRTGPVFATIHKAKGLEHERVYILRPDLMPASYALTAEALLQEDNLSYVAITRAKDALTYGARSVW